MNLRRWLLLLCCVLGVGAAHAQAPGSAQAPVAAQAPARVADAAVKGWLATPAPSWRELSRLPPEEACKALPQMAGMSVAPAGTTVNLQDRVLRENTKQEKVFTYPMRYPGGQLEVLGVWLEPQPAGAQGAKSGWQVARVGLFNPPQTASIPAVLQRPAAAWAFVVFSLYFAYLLWRPSFLRRLLAQGWALLKRYRRLSLFTILLLYGLFTLGMVTGASMPQACEAAVNTLVSSSVEALGATQAYDSGNVARAALVTVYQNFIMGAVVTTYGSALMSFGVLAYLLNGARFLVLGVPFGFLFSADAATVMSVLVLIIVELMAYVVVTIGGGMFLATVVRQGLRGIPEGVQALALTLPIALTLLMLGGWYEAAMVIVPKLF